MTIVSRLRVDVYGLVSDVCIYSGDCIFIPAGFAMDGSQFLWGYAAGFSSTL